MSANVALRSLAPQPSHVPDAVVYDFDTFADPGVLRDGHGGVTNLINNAPPVFWTPRNGGHWIVRGYSAVCKASRDTEAFSNEHIPFAEVRAKLATATPESPPIYTPVPGTVDPPLHAMYRMPLQSAFSPKAMGALKGDIRGLAIELIEKVREEGKCEFMSAVAEPLPVQIFLKMFGLPVERQRQYRDLVVEHMAATDNSGKAVHERHLKLTAIMRQTVLERQRERKADLISLLWSSTFEGKPATLNDVDNYCIVLFTAGLDTVMNGMGFGIRHLADNPGLQVQLRREPGLIPEFSEELLRRYTFTVPPRRIAKDITFEGVEMKQGERAVLLLPAADLDPAEFTSPEEFDLARENKVHIAFGVGPHRCLGSHLARFELNILYEEMLKRLPEFRLNPERPVTYHGGHVWGPNELHLEWDV